MGKTYILVEDTEDWIRKMFLNIKDSCSEFYTRHDKLSDLLNMRIAGRLDFITDEQAEKIKEYVESYKHGVEAKEIEAMYLEWRYNMTVDKAKAASIQVEMTGMITLGNEALFHKIITNLLNQASPQRLDMIYESYSPLLRGSLTNKGFNPWILIQGGPEPVVIVNNKPQQSNLEDVLGLNIAHIQPKEDVREYFYFGK